MGEGVATLVDQTIANYPLVAGTPYPRRITRGVVDVLLPLLFDGPS
jgi:hypothetical protein